MTLDDIRVRCEECGECWHWIGYGGLGGRHPQIKMPDGKAKLVRRLAFEAWRGQIKLGLRVLATCGDPRCINPEHQRAMTESQKGKRAAARGAFSSPARGAKIAASRRGTHAKLTLEQALEIRMSEESGPALSERYGIHRSRVNAIKRGEAWRDYGNPFAGLMR